MKPQDLRIGNYVRIKGSDMAKVIAIMNDKVVVAHRRHQLSDDMLAEFFDYPGIEPVLIREVYNVLSEIPHLSNHLMWADKALCEDLYYYDRIPLSDLHELQNIHYALTGNEIEIEI